MSVVLIIRAATGVGCVTAESEQPPLRVLFGALFGVPVPEIVRGIYDRRLKERAAWEDLAVRAYGR